MIDDYEEESVSSRLGHMRAVADIQGRNIEIMLAAVERAGLTEKLSSDFDYVLAVQSHERMKKAVAEELEKK